MELNHLKYFHAVIKEGGFTQASRKLLVAQPSVSRMVKTLEDDLGARLLERGTRSFRLTAKGRAVFEHCERIFGEVEKLKNALNENEKVLKGPLNLAASEPIASVMMPTALARFKREHPHVVPAVFAAPAQMVFAPIAKGRIEFGLFFHIPESPAGLEVRRFARVPFRLVVAKAHVANTKTRAAFIGSREVDDSAPRRYPTIERMRKAGITAKIEFSSNSLSAHKALVIEGAGVSVLPEMMVKGELATGELVEVLPGERFEFEMKLVSRRQALLSRQAMLFLEELRVSF